MIIFGILGLLLLPAIALTISQAIKPSFARSWFIAIAGASLAWLGAFFLRLYLPMEVELVRWQPESLYHTAIGLRVDYTNWHYLVAILALCVAVTRPIQPSLLKHQPGFLGCHPGADRSKPDFVMSRAPDGCHWAITDLVELFYS